jgi:ubiquinone biosynthesis protein
MQQFGQFFRLLKISWVLGRHGLDELILASHLFRPLYFLKIFMPWNWRTRQASRGERIRRALEDLGPIFVKFGQILSTRRDLLPDDIADELARLQDQVPPFPDVQARQIIEASLGCRIETLFRDFEPTPFASASIAQVHGAILKDGREVVVKVLRPGILAVIRRDIRLLYTVAAKIERYWSAGKQLRPVEVVAEFEKTILDELDLMREGANASQLRRNFAGSQLLYVPEVHWEYTRREVMVMERIHGIPISQIDALRAAGIDLKTLAEHGVEIFFTQVFRDSFFHADMHPGNIFVAPDGQYIAVDFGIMGSLNATDQRYLAENFLAFFNRDYRRVAQLHVDSGWVAPETRVEEFEAAIRTVCEPIFDKPLSEISFGQVLLRLFQTARRFNMEVQPQLVLLQKTLLNIEGLGRQLYPQLDLWATAKPFLERWMREQIGPRAFLKHLKENAPLWAERLPALPNMLYELLEQAKAGELKMELQPQQLNEIKQEIRRANRRSYGAVTGGSLLVSAAVLTGLDGYSPTMLGDLPLSAWILGSLGVIILLAAWPNEK